uniref:Leucine carboxyl methyltransferase 1 n=1 Tax=Piliocolobus tephrosceles TaxID=591936 RepID=A0A8C9LKQ2_9PRIM
MLQKKIKNSTSKPCNKVQTTTYEAASSKYSAVLKGYYNDPFLKYFVQKVESRSPLINRGYYSRVVALRQYIDLFFKSLDNAELIQLVNIGAGLDTIFFWTSERYKNVNYYELDFHELLIEKTDIINNAEELKKFLKYEETNINDKKKPKGLIDCTNYKMLPFNLNECGSIEQKLIDHNFDFSLPTLFLCECVLIYLEIQSSDILINILSDIMKNTSCIIVYEQVSRCVYIYIRGI